MEIFLVLVVPHILSYVHNSPNPIYFEIEPKPAEKSLAHRAGSRVVTYDFRRLLKAFGDKSPRD
jgi:hypothetical protein